MNVSAQQFGLIDTSVTETIQNLERRCLARVAARKHHGKARPCDVCGNAKSDWHHDDYS